MEKELWAFRYKARLFWSIAIYFGRYMDCLFLSSFQNIGTATYPFNTVESF
jgi:hypothetical protein